MTFRPEFTKNMDAVAALLGEATLKEVIYDGPTLSASLVNVRAI